MAPSWKLRIRIVTLCTAAIPLTAALFWQLEPYLHIYALRRIQRSATSVSGSLEIDTKLDDSIFHRDRLVQRGVYFYKVYRFDRLSVSSDTHVWLFKSICSAFPDNHLWMLSTENVLEVWDFKAREADWDQFVLHHDVSERE